MPSSRNLKLLGLLGLGSFVVGALLYQKARKGALAGSRQRRNLQGRNVAQAPVVSEYTIGGMKTKLRRSSNMSIEQRVASIQDLVHSSVQDPRIRKLAIQITKDCPERDGTCEAKAIYHAIKRRVRYTGDIAPIKQGSRGEVEGIDLFQSAYRTWEFGGGDCDDHSILAASLLAAIGIEPKLRVIAESRGDDWSHIYPVAGLPKLAPTKFVPLDTTLPGDRKFGVEVPYAKKIDFDA